MKMWWDSFNIAIQVSLTRVQVQCIYIFRLCGKAKVWSINSNTLWLHFNTDLNFNKHKLWLNKPKAYKYPVTKGKINGKLLAF